MTKQKRIVSLFLATVLMLNQGGCSAVNLKDDLLTRVKDITNEKKTEEIEEKEVFTEKTPEPTPEATPTPEPTPEATPTPEPVIDEHAGEIQFPLGSDECIGKDYKEIQQAFVNAGFDHITLNTDEYVSTETDYKDGEIIVIRADDQSSFKKDEYIDEASQIIINYATVVEPAYIVTDHKQTMYATRNVNVREEPMKEAAKLGSLSTDTEIYVTGKVDNGWYRINYQGDDGFVSGDYLTAEKKIKEVEVAKTQPTEEPVVYEEMVWIPRTGSKYHRRSTCSNMKNPTEVTLSVAESRGFTPCKRCY